jgi:hypothetical protein
MYIVQFQYSVNGLWFDYAKVKCKKDIKAIIDDMPLDDRNVRVIKMEAIYARERIKQVSYFPIRIRNNYTGEYSIVNTPEELPQGVSFMIIDTNVKEK